MPAEHISTKAGAIPRFPLIKGGQEAPSVTVNPLSGKDQFRISAAFAKPMSVTAIWVDTRGKSTVVENVHDAPMIEYPSKGAFVSPEAADPSGYEAIALVQQPGAEPVSNSELARALDDLIPPTRLQTDERGPGNVTAEGGPSFLGFQDEVRKRLPKGLDLLKIIFVPRQKEARDGP